MKSSRMQTFVALTAMVFAILTIAHFDFYVVMPLPWQVILIGSRLVVADNDPLPLQEVGGPGTHAGARPVIYSRLHSKLAEADIRDGQQECVYCTKHEYQHQWITISPPGGANKYSMMMSDKVAKFFYLARRIEGLRAYAHLRHLILTTDPSYPRQAQAL